MHRSFRGVAPVCSSQNWRDPDQGSREGAAKQSGRRFACVLRLLPPARAQRESGG